MEASATPLEFKYQVSFRALTSARRSVAFPCDANGCVDLAALSEREMNAYLFARATRGRDYAAPAVQVRASQAAC